MTRRGTFARDNAVGQFEELLDGTWQASVGDVAAAGPTPLDAVVAAVGPPTGMAIPTVLMEIDLAEDEVAACCEAGIAFTYGLGTYVLPTPDGHDELSCDEHPDYEEIATTHGVPQSDDEVDIDGTDFLVARVGRIGRQYFEVDADTQVCTCLGWFDSPEAAANAAAGADLVYRLVRRADDHQLEGQ